MALRHARPSGRYVGQTHETKTPDARWPANGQDREARLNGGPDRAAVRSRRGYCAARQRR